MHVLVTGFTWGALKPLQSSLFTLASSYSCHKPDWGFEGLHSCTSILAHAQAKRAPPPHTMTSLCTCANYNGIRHNTAQLASRERRTSNRNVIHNQGCLTRVYCSEMSLTLFTCFLAVLTAPVMSQSKLRGNAHPTLRTIYMIVSITGIAGSPPIKTSVWGSESWEDEILYPSLPNKFLLLFFFFLRSVHGSG